jgi:hypothetical protein
LAAAAEEFVGWGAGSEAWLAESVAAVAASAFAFLFFADFVSWWAGMADIFVVSRKSGKWRAVEASSEQKP